MRSRQKILDATVGIVETDGFAAASIAAVAAAAGVSRQTIYSIFGTREDLISQATLGLATDALGEITARLEETTTPFDYVAEMFVLGRAAVRDHPVLATLLSPTQSNPFFDEGMMDRAKPVATLMLEPLMARHPEAADEIREAIDVILWLGVSVITFDGAAVHTDDSLRHFLDRWLRPLLPSVE